MLFYKHDYKFEIGGVGKIIKTKIIKILVLDICLTYIITDI